MDINIVIFASICFYHASYVLADENSYFTDVRLRDGDTDTSGRVEIYSDNVWRPICDEDWTIQDSTVVCRQLNLGIFGLPVKEKGSEGFVLSTSEKTVTDEIFGSGEDLEEASSLYDPDTYSVVSCIGEFDPCEDNPCSSKGACTHQKNGRYVCICYDGFTGDDCGSENSASHRSPLLTYLFIFIFVIIIVIVAAVIFCTSSLTKNSFGVAT
ncbi:putative scavenger receptor cysteine-rich domain-containing group B protein [Apostichopus japonicus]|uniref:Putative scavenger receptor cysteine-rich domain-containing group B protein n=1 Tax=Stichopus japonicus TaxID=307972 RepID=A0A2G8LIX4_STIJA|nr:putative scavenger receptor cysteine-rich domain-containing group B protein [Apostichopus japonicus]